MCAIDKHHPSNLGRVKISIHARYQATPRVANEHIRRGDSGLAQQFPKLGRRGSEPAGSRSRRAPGLAGSIISAGLRTPGDLGLDQLPVEGVVTESMQ